ncbi:hypothetical protein [Nocardia salmonicida]|uniref:hypothetical protein n=1 Tax=Nocardia salmonicida TaxID=53431 RepID=UPI0037AA51D8
MSKGQLARTPDNFPRMRYRARKRNAHKDFDRALLAFIGFDPDFATALGTSLGVFVDQLKRLAVNVRTMRAALEADHAARIASMRRPWFETLADAEARGAHGSGEIGHAQCDCDACEKADAERFKITPIEEILRNQAEPQDDEPVCEHHDFGCPPELCTCDFVDEVLVLPGLPDHEAAAIVGATLQCGQCGATATAPAATDGRTVPIAPLTGWQLIPDQHVVRCPGCVPAEEAESCG